MFKKSIVELKPPQPPTFGQIMEDMETFLVEKSPIEKVLTLPSATDEANTSCNDVDGWWKVFETFNSDNEDLQTVRRKLVASQKQLEDQKKEIIEKTESIQRDIDLALQDPPIDLC